MVKCVYINMYTVLLCQVRSCPTLCQEQQENCLDSQKTGNEGERGKTGEVRSSLGGVAVCVCGHSQQTRRMGWPERWRLEHSATARLAPFSLGKVTSASPLRWPLQLYSMSTESAWSYTKKKKKKQAFFFSVFYIFQWKLKLNLIQLNHWQILGKRKKKQAMFLYIPV